MNLLKMSDFSCQSKLQKKLCLVYFRAINAAENNIKIALFYANVSLSNEVSHLQSIIEKHD